MADDFLLYFVCGTSLLSVQQIISQHTGNPLALVQLFHGGVPYSSLTAPFLGRSLRIAHLKTYYIPQLCRIVQDEPPYHDSFLPYDFQKKMAVRFLNEFHAAFSTSLCWSSNFTFSVNLFEVQQIPLL